MYKSIYVIERKSPGRFNTSPENSKTPKLADSFGLKLESYKYSLSIFKNQFLWTETRIKSSIKHNIQR